MRLPSRAVFPVVAVSVAVVLLGGVVAPVIADDLSSPIVGSLNVGGSAVSVDERTGRVSTGVELASLAGIGGIGGVGLGVSYSQERDGVDEFGLGAGWGFGLARVDLSSGTPTVFPASGGAYEADDQSVSGLARYPQEDVRFRQEVGVLEFGASESVAYGFVLETVGGGADYFKANGHLALRRDAFGHTVSWEWDETTGRLLSVADAAGSRLVLEWGDAQLRVHAPTRSDGVTPRPVVIEITEHGVASVEDQAGETTTFEYDERGLLTSVLSPVGVTTRVAYREAIDRQTTASTVTVFGAAGRELSQFTWAPASEELFTGFPIHEGGESALWSSGDGSFRYRTRVSDGYTSVVSTYNSMGLLLERDLSVSTPTETETVRQDRFTYPGTQTGHVPTPSVLRGQYALPVESTIVFRDGERSRSVTERNEYDGMGRVISHTDSLGTTTTTVYDQAVAGASELPIGLVMEQTITGPDGTVSKTVNTLSEDRKSIAATETLTGTAEGEMASVTHSTFVVENDGFISESTVSASESAHVARGPERVTTRFNRHIDDAAGLVTVQEVTAAGTTAESSTSVVSDLVTGLVMRSIDEVGRITANTFDGVGRVTSVTDPSGHVSEMSYEDHGLTTRARTSDGARVSTYRDVFGNVLKVTNNLIEGPDSSLVLGSEGAERTIELREYDKNNSVVTVTDAVGRTAVSESDVFGRPRVGITENGVSQLYVYDDVQNTITTGVTTTPERGLAGALRTSTRYGDNAGRETKATGARRDGMRVPESSAIFDGLGRATTSSGGDITSSVVFNADGTPKTTTATPLKTSEFPGQKVTTERTYDMTGASTHKKIVRGEGSGDDARVEDRGEGITSERDAAGRTISKTDQAGSVTRFTYTPDGLVLTAVNETSGEVTRNSFDAVTRALVETVTSRAGVDDIRRLFTYDDVTGHMLSVFDPADRDGTEVRYSYDVHGNRTSTTYPDGKSLSHVFDVNGRETQSIDVAGNVTSYTYTEFGMLESATQVDASGDMVATEKYEYDVWGRTAAIARGNGAVTMYSYTSADEVAHERSTDGNGTVIFDGSYTYDSHGNLTQKTVKQKHADTPELSTETWVHGYNAYNHLTGSRVFNGDTAEGSPAKHTEYEIGVKGSVTKETVTAGDATTVRELEYNALGQTTAIMTNGVRSEQTYDASGNLTRAADGTHYVYNAENRPVVRQTSDSTETATSYWVTGRVASQNVDDSRTELYWEGDVLTNEVRSDFSSVENSGAVVSSYLFGAGRSAVTRDTDRRTEYFISDRHGSTMALVGAEGGVTESYSYSDYGVATAHRGASATSDDVTRFQYSGEYMDADGSQLLGSRVYLPTSFGFTTRDSAPLYNLYAYGSANPITRIDPSGNTSTADWFASGGYATIVGMAGAIVGLAASVSPAAGSVAVGVAVFAGLFDIGVGVAQIANGELGFMSEQSSAAWGWAAMGAGVGLGLGVAGARLATRARTTAAPRAGEETSLIERGSNATGSGIAAAPPAALASATGPVSPVAATPQWTPIRSVVNPTHSPRRQVADANAGWLTSKLDSRAPSSYVFEVASRSGGLFDDVVLIPQIQLAGKKLTPVAKWMEGKKDGLWTKTPGSRDPHNGHGQRLVYMLKSDTTYVKAAFWQNAQTAKGKAGYFLSHASDSNLGFYIDGRAGYWPQEVKQIAKWPSALRSRRLAPGKEMYKGFDLIHDSANRDGTFSLRRESNAFDCYVVEEGEL